MASQPTAPRQRQGGEPPDAVRHTPTKIWVAVALIILGFTMGAVSIPLHSVALLIAGIVIFVLSCGLAWAFGIMENVH